MDMSTLAKQDKKELRKEVRTIKQKLMSTGNGVYISVGAIIIILLLIIIIL
jgi:archaellum biogenesis protein FlaJ (TadC family)